MDDFLKMAETKPAINKASVKKKVKSKYTDEQKAAANRALEIAKELNEIMKQVAKRNASQ